MICPGKCTGCRREDKCSEPFKYTYGDTSPALASDTTDLPTTCVEIEPEGKIRVTES
jgi:hypothetical protein